ncbi:hypothetical protein OAT67_08125 [Bacteriovoracaceae bacterium]|nr:hypothetical protein [Bacteriovoracaceae bacterium]
MGLDILFVMFVCGLLVERKKLTKMTSIGLCAFYVMYSIGFKMIFFRAQNYNKVFLYSKKGESYSTTKHGTDYLYESEHYAAVFLNIHAPLVKPLWWLYSYPITYYRINYDPDFHVRKKMVDGSTDCKNPELRDKKSSKWFYSCFETFYYKIRLQKEMTKADLDYLYKDLIDIGVSDCNEKRKGDPRAKCLSINSWINLIDRLVKRGFKLNSEKSKVRDYDLRTTENPYFDADKIYLDLCKNEKYYGCSHFFYKKYKLDFELFIYLLERYCLSDGNVENCDDLIIQNLIIDPSTHANPGYKKPLIKMSYIEKQCYEDSSKYYCKRYASLVKGFLKTGLIYNSIYMTADLIEWSSLNDDKSSYNFYKKLDKYGQGLGNYRGIRYINDKDDYEYLKAEVSKYTGLKKDAYMIYYLLSWLEIDKKAPLNEVNRLTKKFYEGCNDKNWRYCVLGYTFERKLFKKVARGISKHTVNRKYCEKGFIIACDRFYSFNKSEEDKQYVYDKLCNHRTNLYYTNEHAQKRCEYLKTYNPNKWKKK